MLAPPARQPERAVRDPRDLALVVRLGVPHLALPLGRRPLAALAEVDAARQLAHDQHVGALDDLRPQRRQRDHLRVHHHRPQVHEQVERPPQPQDRRRLDAAPLRVVRLARRPAERALEDRVGVPAGVERHGRQVLAVALPRLAARVRLDELELVPEPPAHRRQHPQRLVRDLRPDPVAPQHRDLEIHARSVAAARFASQRFVATPQRALVCEHARRRPEEPHGQVKVATLNLFNRMGAVGPPRAARHRPARGAAAPTSSACRRSIWSSTRGCGSASRSTRACPACPTTASSTPPTPTSAPASTASRRMSRIGFEEHEILDLMTFERVAQRMGFHCGDQPFCLVNTHLHFPPEATAGARRPAQLPARLARPRPAPAARPSSSATSTPTPSRRSPLSR